MKILIPCLLGVLCFTGCQKVADELADIKNTVAAPAATSKAIEYLIKKGNHACEQSTYRLLSLNELKFTVQFDSSAIYQTTIAENQYDINKLYGFSDNNAFHQEYSARFGWGWSDGALHLYGYTYNKGARSSEEISTLPIGAKATCSIKVTATAYLFSVNNIIKSMPRLSTTIKAEGYQLYPYFGGDETAPHDVHIWIKNL